MKKKKDVLGLAIILVIIGIILATTGLPKLVVWLYIIASAVIAALGSVHNKKVAANEKKEMPKPDDKEVT